MKSDRLYGITLYLLNHKRASAAQLATYFEVSQRSIQRDIDSLCMAGVPIVAYTGIHGGYEIQEEFKMQAQMASKEDYALIVASLQGYESATNATSTQRILQKIQTFSKEEHPVRLDFRIANEKEHVNMIRVMIEKALQTNSHIQMLYTNATDVTSSVMCEPIVLLFQWYAWYMIAYDSRLGEYRTYKLQRMEDVVITEQSKQKHPAIQTILQNMHKEDKRNFLHIKLYCKKASRVKVLEYFNGEIIHTCDNGDFLYVMHMPEWEYFWYANLLGMGTNVEVIQPISLRERIQTDCRKLLAMYEV